MTTRRTPRGFTLIELLVVIAIIAILAAILFPVFAKAREKSRQAQCISNIRQITLGVQMHQQDHEGLFPDKETVWQDLNVTPKVLNCPTYGAKMGNGYGYNKWISGKSLSDSAMPPAVTVVVFADSKASDHLITSINEVDPRHTDKSVVGFGDGHVQVIAPKYLSIIPIGHELLSEQGAAIHSKSDRVYTRATYSSSVYWQSFQVDPPVNWVSNENIDVFSQAVNQYFGSYTGTNLYADYGFGLYGSYNYSTDWPGNPSVVNLQIPINSNTPGNYLTATNGWVLSIPNFAPIRFGLSADIVAPAAPAALKGLMQVRVLDDTKTPIATFEMQSTSADSVDFSCNGSLMQTLTGVAILTTGSDWPAPNGTRYKYRYGSEYHTLAMTASLSGNTITCNYSNATVPSIAGAMTVAKQAGDINKPAWLEFRCGGQGIGASGTGAIFIPFQKYGGGITFAEF